jgi:hypothetical protein
MQDFIHILGVSWTFVFVDSIKKAGYFKKEYIHNCRIFQ